MKAGFHICCLHWPSWGAGVQTYRTKGTRWGIASIKTHPLCQVKTWKYDMSVWWKRSSLFVSAKHYKCFIFITIPHWKCSESCKIIKSRNMKYEILFKQDGKILLVAVMFGIFRWADRNFIIMHMFSFLYNFVEKQVFRAESDRVNKPLWVRTL